jgi:hypothetical protein
MAPTRRRGKVSRGAAYLRRGLEDRQAEETQEPPERAKNRRNAEYLAKIDKTIKDLDEGKGIAVTIDELDKMANA